MGVWIRLGALVTLLVTGVVLALTVQTPAVDTLRDGGLWWRLGFVFLYAAACALLLPTAVFSAGAGVVFGLSEGFVLVWAGAMLGAMISFGLGRWLGRDGVVRLAGRHLVTLDQFVERHGVRAVLIARLVPLVPFTAVNYASSVTAVGFRPYVVGTAIGIVPGTLAYVALGASGTHPGSWYFVISVAALLVLAVVGGWWLRRDARAARTQA